MSWDLKLLDLTLMEMFGWKPENHADLLEAESCDSVDWKV
jgi:hypothetical protein